ncbi:cation:proton antiporter [Lentilactobacillus farraginis]|uniref:NhaP family Na+ H+ and K+ H+ antiporter n=2 Tax=Lentilactobacillus farraginis DSM 18382 = JCM 14108 TaxID=1423743 RepID=A0A0R1VLU0_9LACO|nr:sodium:proton antiporter [Lentilactobacillus farraginis]KRM04260.1 NhaP family Na+ H+ and K+ H+ antiporter [Lentilactobacillus farraginis DSM 18382 = JCM 14108]
MDEVLLLTIILAAVVLANILARYFTRIPLPFFLIFLGFLLAGLPVYQDFHLDPSTFALAVISPMLFNEAQNSSRLWIGRSITNILSLAVGLVLVSVLAVGSGLHLIYNILPLSLAFALLAIVTPTDASAVNSIFEANPIAEEQAGILQHESLFNDAAGIVIFDISLTAFISGTFSVEFAVAMFLWEFLGGLLFGSLIGVIIVSIRLFLIRYNDDTPLTMVLIQLLTPFLVYLLAEKLALSGILAVVAAGLVQGSEREKLRLTSSRMQLITSNVWEIVSGSLSGTVFVLLGLSLPEVINAMHQSPNPNFGIYKLIGLGILVYLVKGLIRFIWSRYLIKRRVKTGREWRDSLVMAFSGANGTITLSLAFSMPNTIAGQPFEFRGPLIFLAAVVILISLIMPTIFVPMLLPSQETNQPRYRWVRRMIQAAISDLAKEKAHPDEAQVVIDSLQQQLVLDATPNFKLRRQLMSESHQVELAAVQKLYDAGKITKDEQFYYGKFLQLNNFSADEKIWKNVLLRIRFSLHIGHLYRDMNRVQNAFLTAPIILEEVYWREQFRAHGEDILPIEQAGFDAVMAFLKEKDIKSGVEANMVRRFYRTRHRRIHGKDVNGDIVYQMFLRAFHSEYELIQEALGSGKIDSSLAEKLQQRISIDEMTYLQNTEIFSN